MKKEALSWLAFVCNEAKGFTCPDTVIPFSGLILRLSQAMYPLTASLISLSVQDKESSINSDFHHLFRYHPGKIHA